MLRYVLLAALGAVELLIPERVVAVATRLAYDSPSEIHVKPWVTTAVRIEGLVFLAIALGTLLRSTGSNGDNGDEHDRSGGSDDTGGSRARERALPNR